MKRSSLSRWFTGSAAIVPLFFLLAACIGDADSGVRDKDDAVVGETPPLEPQTDYIGGTCKALVNGVLVQGHYLIPTKQCCTGCISSAGYCLAGNTQTGCGVHGLACDVCEGGPGGVCEPGTCTAGVCGTEIAPEGTLCGAPGSGLACDGAGNCL